MSNSENASQAEREPAWGWWMFWVGIGVLLVFAMLASIQYFLVGEYLPNIEKDDVTKYGISGDFFGFLNALFSALAFAMIIVTLWMQKYELKQQRKELDQTQEIMKLQQQEMQNQREEMHEQNESLRRQRFENTFFGMLELHNQVVSTVNSLNGGPHGRGAFVMIVATLKDFDRKTTSDQQLVSTQNRDHVETYEAWYAENESTVGHYFRTLYNLMRYVDEFGGKERFTYSRLVRAQLSSKELELLAVNGLSKYGKRKFKPLIEKYALLKHLRKSSLDVELSNQYEPSAFGQQEVA